jgi:hypothetical protein
MVMTMKKLFILVTIVGFLSACTEYDFFEDQGFEVTELPGYVAFNGDGTSINYTLDPLDECGTLELEVEAPTGTLSDITVTYALGGTATYGEDYTIDGGSANGGSFTIEHKQSANQDDFNNLDNGSFTIVPVVDNTAEGDETIEVTLVSAVNADGEEYAVGRGGTDYLKSVSINLADVDFDITPGGNYNVAMSGAFGDIAYGTTLTEEAPFQWRMADFAGGIFGVDVDYLITKNDCGWGVTGPATGGSSFATVEADVSGTFDSAGVLTLNVTLQCCGAAGAAYQLIATPQ